MFNVIWKILISLPVEIFTVAMIDEFSLSLDTFIFEFLFGKWQGEYLTFAMFLLFYDKKLVIQNNFPTQCNSSKKILWLWWGNKMVTRKKRQQYKLVFDIANGTKPFLI